MCKSVLWPAHRILADKRLSRDKADALAQIVPLFPHKGNLMKKLNHQRGRIVITPGKFYSIQLSQGGRRNGADMRTTGHNKDLHKG